MEKTARLDSKIGEIEMKHLMKKILNIVLIATFAWGVIAPGFAESNEQTTNVVDVQNVAVAGDVQDLGDNVGSGDNNEQNMFSLTEQDRQRWVRNLGQDVEGFAAGYERDYIETGVPIEAKLGVVFANALSYIARVLDMSLVRFVRIFLLVAFLFWVMFEAYRLITDAKVKALPTFQDIAKRGIILAIWLIVLSFGLSELFGSIMGPIMEFGSYISNLILDTVSQIGGFELSDTCGAIHAYTAEHMKSEAVIDSQFAVNIMCVPTRMSGFYYGAIKFGLSLWGIGSASVNVVSILAGLALVILFIYTAFKFAFVACGVIADLFLVIILLPFTAISENLHKTSYKGIAGDIYNGFLGLFQNFSMSSQVRKFIDAAVYFIASAIVVSIVGALLAMSIDWENIDNMVLESDYMQLLLTGALAAYLAAHIDDIAKQIGGAIDASIGEELSKDAKKLYGDAKKTATDIIKLFKKS